MKNLLFFIILFLSIQTYGQESVLSNGEWTKVGISRDGIYKIDKAFLSKYLPKYLDFEPKKIRIFSGHAGALPQANDEERVKDLQEIPIYISDEDNKWDLEDFIAFYAAGPNIVSYENGSYSHSLNPYTKQNYYFITAGTSDAKLIALKDSEIAATYGESLPFFDYSEDEKHNLLNSGRQWFGNLFTGSYRFKPDVVDFTSNLSLKFNILPLGQDQHYLTVETGGKEISKITLPKSLYHANDPAGRYQRVANEVSSTIQEVSEDVNLKISSDGIGTAGCYFDFWEVNYLRKLKFRAGNQVNFRTNYNLKFKNYKLENWKENTMIWQVFSPFSVQYIIPKEGFITLETENSEVIVFDKSSLFVPEFIQKLENQNLKSGLVPELLVVYPDAFKSEAERLISYKVEKEGIEIRGVSVVQIYNEFSSGKQDPSAIRDYCKYLYDLAPEKFKFLLLLGDASFDYKGILADAGNQIPTYESRESLEPIYSYASDDYFGFLNDNEGEWPEGYSLNNRWMATTDRSHLMDIAVGRIPAKTKLELKGYVDKYIAFQSDFKYANWLNRAAFVADNRDYNLHQRDAEELENLAIRVNPALKTYKLYLDDFPIRETDGVNTSPEANKRFHEFVNQGTFLTSYIGHGAADGFTNEKLLTLSDILTFKNKDKPGIWLTATCQFGKFDDPFVVSGAELLLLRENAGSLALLSTTRPVYSSTNRLVNEAVFNNLPSSKTLGELFVKVKNQSISGEINRNFSLLGDPSLPMPNWNNALDFHFEEDTLFAGSTVKFTSTLTNVKSGYALVEILDKASERSTLGTFSDGPKFNYKLNSESIYSGYFPIENYTVSGEINVPIQQIEGVGNGRVLLSAFSDDEFQAAGFSGVFPVKLSSETKVIQTDFTPPEITVSLDSNQNLVCKIFDESGVNVSVINPDTKLLLEIDGDTIENIFNYYVPLEASKSGEIRIKASVYKMKKGWLRASDIYNNTKVQSFEFKVEPVSFRIVSSKVYPNPVVDFLTVEINHNLEGNDLRGSLKILDKLGRILNEKPVQCFDCPQKFNVYLDNIGAKGLSETYFLLELEGVGTKESLSGRLFFWK